MISCSAVFNLLKAYVLNFSFLFYCFSSQFFLFVHYLFIYLWPRWVFVAARRLFLVVASGATLRCGVWASHCGAWALGARASVVVAHGFSCSVACGIFPDQGLNPCPLHWQADSEPLCHQGSPCPFFF